MRKQARLDYSSINETCLKYVMDTDINPGYRTDRSSILLKLKFINNERGRGYWKSNNSLLNNKDYIKLAKDTIQEVIYTYTQPKKKRLIFIVLYLSIDLRYCNKNKTKMFIKRSTHKNDNYWFYLLILKSY